jgi:prepilin-type N-terminal cleavage/methylation domain-containing protein
MLLTHRFTRHARRGFSLLEIAVTITIITVSLAMFAQTMASSKKLDPIASESAIAASAARTVLEEMKNQDFGQLYRLYNALPGDDPGGAGTAPGSTFTVADLTPLMPGASVGTISFPTSSGQLREDMTDAQLGMPRDLDADGVVDDANHANDYLLLPIRIRIEWISKGTKNARRQFEMYTMFSSFRP